MSHALANARRRQSARTAHSRPAQALEAAKSLPKPHGVAGQTINVRLLAELSASDGDAALATLLRCAWEVDPTEQMLAAWLPCLVALDALEQRHVRLPQAVAMRAFIANSLRAQLSRPVAGGEPLWVVPSTAAEEHLAWVLATVLSQRGRAARPWLWERLPVQRPYITVGRQFNARAHNRPDCKAHYALVASDGALGITGLFRGSRDYEAIRQLQERATAWRRDWTREHDRS